VENAVVMALVSFYALVLGLAVRGAIAIWRSRSDPDHQATAARTETTTAERLAAMIEGDDIEDMTIEERILALATGLKNVKHSVNMVTGRLNKLAPPAEKGKGNGGDVAAPERPLTRADVFKRWKERNGK
jgi:predicted homoserine dehydrogenase-like protein